MNNRNILRGLTIAAAVAVVLFCTATTAEAALQMRITSSVGGTITIDDGEVDGGGDDDSSAIVGVILFTGSLGGFTVQVDTGITKPVTGSAAAPEMDLAYVVVKTTAGAETLTIEFSDMGFTTSPLGVAVLYGGTSNNATSTGTAGTGLNNALYNTADASTTLGPFPAAAFSAGSVLSIPLDPAAPYSLTLKVDLVAGGTGTSSGDLQLTNVPEPASLAVWSVLGLAGLGYGGWRRKRASA